MYLVTNHGTRESWRVSDYRDARDIARDQVPRETAGFWHWNPDKLEWWSIGQPPITITANAPYWRPPARRHRDTTREAWPIG